MNDVVVIGGGVIGLSCALELARTGLSVQLLEQALLGREASWAGAGMLPPGNPERATSLDARLRGHSHRLWADWAAQLSEATEIDTGYRQCGAVQLWADDDRRTAECIADWEREGIAIEHLSHADRRERFPQLAQDDGNCCWLPDYAQVRNPRLLKALEAACHALGVEVISGSPVVDVEIHGERVDAVRTDRGRVTAGHFVFAAGAWSQRLLQPLGIESGIQPVRGQMVLLQRRPLPLRCIVERGLQYLVPRADGRILVGSTEESVGFAKHTTAAGIATLIDFAKQTIPDLQHAVVEQTWAGLRPWRPGPPLIGAAPGVRNAVLAAGHFRSGLQLSPVTAVLVRQLVRGESPLMTLDA